MISLLLASSIAASIPGAVERTLADPPQVTREEFLVLTQRVDRAEKIRDSTIACIAESLVLTGADLGSTGLAWDQCPTCKESNPLGLNSDARVGLKFAETGAEVGLCLLSAKKQHGDKAEPGYRLARWPARIMRLLIVANNLYATFTGKSLIKLGSSSEVKP